MLAELTIVDWQNTRTNPWIFILRSDNTLHLQSTMQDLPRRLQDSPCALQTDPSSPGPARTLMIEYVARLFGKAAPVPFSFATPIENGRGKRASSR